MVLHRYPVPGLLAGTVESIWAFDSPDGLPAGSLNMSVANGKTKLLLSNGGGLTAQRLGKPDQHVPANSLNFVGLTTQPIRLLSQQPIRLISVEFAPGMACRIASVPFYEFTNAIESAEAVFGFQARLLERQLLQDPDQVSQLERLTHFLTHALFRSETIHAVTDYAVRIIRQSKGQINLEELTARTGYSHRYVNQQFLRQVGVAPKLFARIIRFQSIYKQLIRQSPCAQADLYEAYYDQSHYIHEFNQFTGYSPLAYVRQMNAFGELFYR